MNAIKTEVLPTYGEAVKAFDSCLNAFADSLPLEESALRTAYLGIHNGIQVRDYALGACGSTLSDPFEVVTFLSVFNAVGSSAHIEAIKGAYSYEGGDIEEANSFLNSALALDSKCSLATLLVRVVSAGWPSGAFASMREELHPKVIEGLKALDSVMVGDE
jgi:hypothetical protein